MRCGMSYPTIRRRIADENAAGFRVGPREIRVDRDSLIRAGLAAGQR